MGQSLGQTISRQWQRALPLSVVGAVPGRSGMQLSLEPSLRIERSLTIGNDMGGFNFDLTKCFNALGRLPIIEFMILQGMPPSAAYCWKKPLDVMGRSVCI